VFRKGLLLVVVSLLFVPQVSSADEFSVAVDAWGGWTSPLGDYTLTGEIDPLDLSGVISGASLGLEGRYDSGPWFLSFLLTGGGSYALTGGTHDVLRLFDAFLGAKAGVSLWSFLRPYVFAGGMYSHYTLLVPYHELNSAVLHLPGFRVGAGMDVRVVAFNVGGYDLALELGPEYVLDIMFSGTSILVHEVRGRAILRFIN
jgi:hypothetical protein